MHILVVIPVDPSSVRPGMTIVTDADEEFLVDEVSHTTSGVKLFGRRNGRAQGRRNSYEPAIDQPLMSVQQPSALVHHLQQAVRDFDESALLFVDGADATETPFTPTPEKDLP